MPDIFLSYNREDQATAQRFAEALQAEGFDVWWDVTLRSGDAYDQVTETALKTAKAVVVLWSRRSVESRWVRAEATLADRNRTLLPVTIEPCERPIMFELTQTADLSRWDGSPADMAWLAFMADVKRFVAARAEPPTPSARAEATPAPADELSIAVLPFVNMSADPEQEYFSDGLTEELLNQLSQLRELRVIGRTSCFAFKGKNEDLRVIGQKLGVAHILEGSVRKAGQRLRITAQLVKCADHHHVWSQAYDRDLDDVFEIQDHVSRAVADALKIALGVGEHAQTLGGTRNVEAYDLYLRALALRQNSGHAATQRAADMMRRAVTIDPQFAAGWLILAETISVTLTYDLGPIERLREERDQALARVMAIAPELWTGHAARAYQLFNRREFLAAEEAYRRAIQLGPRPFPEATIFTALIANAGRIRESIPYLTAVREADPLRPLPTLQMLLGMAGRDAEAEAEYAREKDMASGPLQLADWFAFSHTLATRDRAGARRHLERLIPTSPNRLVVNDELLAVFDDPDAAIVWIRGKLDDPSPEMRSVTILFAFLAAYFGAPEFALQLLRRIYIELRQGTPVMNIWHPVFADVRKLPGFKDLVRDLGIDDYWRGSGKWGDFAQPRGQDDFEIIR
jgi:adenylate cyclase